MIFRGLTVCLKSASICRADFLEECINRTVKVKEKCLMM